MHEPSTTSAAQCASAVSLDIGTTAATPNTTQRIRGYVSARNVASANAAELCPEGIDQNSAGAFAQSCHE